MPSTGMKPPKLLLAVSVLIITGTGLLISAFIAAIVDELNPFALVSAGMLLPWCAVLAIQQYRGIFRGVPSGALTAAVLLFTASGLFLLVMLGTIANIVTCARDAITWGMIMPPLAVPLVGMAICLLMASIDLRWANRLRRAYATGLARHKRSAVTGREGILLLAILAAMVGATSYMIASTPPRYAEHIDPAAAPFRLPAGASDVSYRKGYRGSITYEFNINEHRFRTWVASGIGSRESDLAGVTVKNITDAFTIPRYTGWVPQSNEPEEVTITDGLYYSWSRQDRGVYAGYDRSSGRAYYYAHFH